MPPPLQAGHRGIWQTFWTHFFRRRTNRVFQVRSRCAKKTQKNTKFSGNSDFSAVCVPKRCFWGGPGGSEKCRNFDIFWLFPPGCREKKWGKIVHKFSRITKSRPKKKSEFSDFCQNFDKILSGDTFFVNFCKNVTFFADLRSKTVFLGVQNVHFLGSQRTQFYPPKTPSNRREKHDWTPRKSRLARRCHPGVPGDKKIGKITKNRKISDILCFSRLFGGAPGVTFRGFLGVTRGAFSPPAS